MQMAFDLILTKPILLSWIWFNKMPMSNTFKFDKDGIKGVSYLQRMEIKDQDLSWIHDAMHSKFFLFEREEEEEEKKMESSLVRLYMCSVTI